MVQKTKKPKNIIVVGNSPSVLQYAYGDLIDKFDMVIRCNWYKIKGFERHVGTKISVWAVAAGKEFSRAVTNPNEIHNLNEIIDPTKSTNIKVWLRKSLSKKRNKLLSLWNKKYPDLKCSLIPDDWIRCHIGLCALKKAVIDFPSAKIYSIGNTFYEERHKNKEGRFHYYDFHLDHSDMEINLAPDGHDVDEAKISLNELPVTVLENFPEKKMRKNIENEVV
tara:strand:+ start:9850 stop:10515 length:666 start_codon:yes stop_codon:yes gene_type:complete